MHLPRALATGNLDVLTNAMVREVEIDKSGKASGVVFIDKTTGRELRASARIVVLAASACATVHILLKAERLRQRSDLSRRYAAGDLWPRTMSEVQAQFAEGAVFFEAFRRLAAVGFYTTPIGRNDLQYVGNEPLVRFDGPPAEVLRHVGLA